MRANFSRSQVHIGSVASLATSFGVLFRKQRPQPVLVIAVSFFNAGGGAAIALMTRRATKLVRIMRLQ